MEQEPLKPHIPFENEINAVPDEIKDQIRCLIKKPYKVFEDKKHPDGSLFSLEEQIEASAEHLFIFVGEEILAGSDPKEAFDLVKQVQKRFLDSQEPEKEV